MVFFHCYADDTQLYVPVQPTDLSMLSSLQDWIVDIKNWMNKNFLQSNSTKTEILVICFSKTNIQILPSTGYPPEYIMPVARNPGNLFDGLLN